MVTTLQWLFLKLACRAALNCYTTSLEKCLPLSMTKYVHTSNAFSTPYRKTRPKYILKWKLLDHIFRWGICDVIVIENFSTILIFCPIKWKNFRSTQRLRCADYSLSSWDLHSQITISMQNILILIITYYLITTVIIKITDQNIVI